jgi:hypothetical protein
METKTYISDQTELVKLTQARAEEKFVKRFKPHTGHTMFEINKVTGDVCVAEFENKALSFDKALNNDVSGSKKIIMKPDCIYVSALNIKNALKKMGIKNIKVHNK